ncbi:MAG TPA: acetyl-CoA C-acetyltransferase, partial [Alteromonas macleodii]|nr:acetyl-CoA C-acetyltransferase [Alteromonas macleodii]
MSNESVVIVAAKRTPMGGFNGNLSSLAATKLGEVAIKAACEEMDVSVIDEVIMGCVLPAGLGQSPARQASLGAGLPLSA